MTSVVENPISTNYLKGINGWLILVAIGLITRVVLGSVGLMLNILPFVFSQFGDSQEVGAGYLSFAAVLLVFNTVMTVLFFLKKRIFVTIKSVCLFAATIVAAVLSVIVGALFYFSSDNLLLAVVIGLVALAVSTSWNLAWLLYFRRSRRVLATFIR